MEEIKVGEYVKTHKGKIYKVTNIYVLKVTCSHTSIRYNDIKKHSPNIIDLIETGDYVNGHLVIAVDREKLEVSIENCMYGSDYEDINGNIDIKSIVTKEQFETMKYEVK